MRLQRQGVVCEEVARPQQDRIHVPDNLRKKTGNPVALNICMYNSDTILQNRWHSMRSTNFCSSLWIYTGTSSIVMYLFKMNRVIANRRNIILFSLLLFVAMQYSAVAHASVHFLHTPDELCSIYIAIEHSSADLVVGAVATPVIAAQSDAVIYSSPVIITTYLILPPSRAPPRA